MKKIFRNLLLCLLVFVSVFGLASCTDSKTIYEGTSEPATENGGLSVEKGDYLIFVNGYNSYTKVSSNKSSFSNGGVYITKTENGKISVDDNGSLKQYSKLSSKLAGYEATNLYVFGDYLYFTSPVTEKYGNGSLANNLSSFYKVNLNGESEPVEILQTDVDSTDCEYQYYSDASSVYLLLYQNGQNHSGSTVNKVTLTKCNVKKPTTETIISNPESIYIPSKTEITASSKIYYTSTLSTSDNKNGYTIGNKICSFDLSSGNTTVERIDNDTTYSVESEKGGFLYVKAKPNDGTEFLYMVDVSLIDSALSSENYKQLSWSEYSAVYYLDDAGFGVLMTVKQEDSKQVLKLIKSKTSRETISTEYTNIIGVKGSSVFAYNDDKTQIVEINISTKKVSVIADLSDEDLTILTDSSKYFDIENSYIYYYVQYKSGNNYLYRSSLTTSVEKTEMVGVLESEDIPEEEEETESEE